MGKYLKRYVSVAKPSRILNTKPETAAFSTRVISLATVLTALGVVLAPFLWFPVLDTKAYPGQHLVNAVAGVLLGPFWAALIAFFIGLIRMSLGIGTIFSMPGGIPGGIVVGLVYWILKRSGIKQPELAALAESLGTVFIGGTLAVYLFAPLFGRTMLLIPIWIGWAISSVPGSVMGLIILGALRATGFTRERFRR